MSPPPPTEAPRRPFTGRRPLTARERALVTELFGPSFDPDRVVIWVNGPLTLGIPKVILDTLYVPRVWGGKPLLDEHGAFVPEREHVFVHECVHLWQHQRGGRAYLGESVGAQLAALLRGEGRQGAYRWDRAFGAGLDWSRWNPEQQAAAVEWWFLCRERQTKRVSAEDAAVWAERLTPLLERLRAGDGAPRRSPWGAALFGGLGVAVGVFVGLLLGETLTAPGVTLAVAAGVLGAAGARWGWG
ncbi:MAG: hypothetical protein IPO67_00645 [Deltaproteobacteria bacterium]|nr:hypothetical protein [Deltaproteobacteria bacterium]